MSGHAETIHATLTRLSVGYPGPEDANEAHAALDALVAEIEYLRDRAVCSGCGGDVAESGACLAECGEGEMIPASALPTALRAMRESRDEWYKDGLAGH